MRAKSRQQPETSGKESFSRQIKSELSGLSVKKTEDKRSLLAGITLSGTPVKGEAKEVLDRYKDVLSPSGEGLSLDPGKGGRLFLRGVFLACGYATNPKDAYRIELRPVVRETADTVTALLTDLQILFTRTDRSDVYSVYIRNGDSVSDFLGVIGANNARLDFENIRIERDLKSEVNREVNCDSGNAGRQADAAARRGELIGKLLSSPEAEKLPAGLYEAAVVHQANPGASIAELGSLMDPPLGKSGMNHRLNRLLEIAEGM